MITSKKRLVPILEKELGPLTFGMFLRTARNQQNASQVDFSKKLKIARGTLCDIEKGRQIVSVALALKIARRLKLPEKMALKACLQDQLSKEKITMQVDLKVVNS